MLVDIKNGKGDSHESHEFHESFKANSVSYGDDHNWLMETNIDDMSSELLVYAEEKL